MNHSNIHKFTQIVETHGRFVISQLHNDERSKEKPKPSMQHSAPSSSRNSHRKCTNQQHLHLNCLHININKNKVITTLNIPAVSHNYHRKISKIDTSLLEALSWSI